jgi:hypothetical protein
MIGWFVGGCIMSFWTLAKYIRSRSDSLCAQFLCSDWRLTCLVPWLSIVIQLSFRIATLQKSRATSRATSHATS